MPTVSDLETITRIIRSRRTIKPAAMDPNRTIPGQLLHLLLENATWAPTHGMTEPWFFQIHEGSYRAALAEKLQSLYLATTPPGEFRPDKFEKLGANPLLAPTVLTVWMRRQLAQKIPEIEEVEAVACALQNLHLSAAAAGLAAFWSSPPLLASAKANATFEMGENDRCLGLFYLGWPAPGHPWPTSSRTPLEFKISRPQGS